MGNPIKVKCFFKKTKKQNVTKTMDITHFTSTTY